MKIILAFDSFKGCISASQACHAAATSLRDRYPHATLLELPLSDGGEGLVECVSRLLPTRTINIKAHGPLMEPIEATYALSSDGSTAYMEMAATSGLTLVPQAQRNPLKTTTYGVGDMIYDAVKRGCREIVMGIGGSATCDAGAGMIASLQNHLSLDPPIRQRAGSESDSDSKLPLKGVGGSAGSESDSYSKLPLKGVGGSASSYSKLPLKGVGGSPLPAIRVACDVSNPLYGPDGAAYVFAPQKGATPEQVEWLDKRLRQFAQLTEEAGIASPTLALHPGAGAAGGLGYALMAYLGAELQPGIDVLLSLARFDQLLHGASCVITGEGKSDRQTLMGKVPQGVLRWAQEAGVPAHLLSGAIEDVDALLEAGFASVRSINEGDTRSLEVLLRPEIALENMALTVSSLFILSH